MFTFDYDKIDKDYILSRATEEEIMKCYIGDKFTYRKHFHSPFREDKNPSFSVRKYGDKVIYRDWATGETGDAFKFVQRYYNCDFYQALLHINRDLDLGPNVPAERHYYCTHKKLDEHNSRFNIQTQPYTLTDVKFWKQFGISINTLVKYNVFSARYVWVNSKLVRSYSNSNPNYAYKFREGIFKIYSPYGGKRAKWLFNGTKHDVEGYDALPENGKTVIITKSLKDVMTLYELGYHAVSLQSECNPIKPELYEDLSRRFNSIIVLYDNDETGISMAIAASEKFDVPYIIVPNYKDISDFVKANDVRQASQLMQSLISDIWKNC